MDELAAWLPVAIATALAVAFVVWPLLRRRGPAEPTEDAARVYRSQLDELDRDHAEGRIGTAEHQAARAEVARRLIAAVAKQGEAQPARPTGRAAILAASVLLPVLGAGVYLWHGSPGMPAIPFAEQEREAQGADAIVAQLRSTVQLQPAGSETRRQGLVLLGGVERRRGEWQAAETAWREALAIRFEAPLAEDLAELLTARAGGLVTEDARRLLDSVRATGVTGPRLVYLLARSDLQAGRRQAAIHALDQLLSEAPADAPWRPLVAALREEAAGLAAAPSEAERAETARAEAEMIAGMVARLEARLAEQPADGEGWLRLARAKRVLGDRDAAAAALQRASALLPDDPRVAAERAALEG